MNLKKQTDGYWHWKYTGANNRQHIRILWMCWLFVMLVLFAVWVIVPAVVGLPKEMIPTLLRILLGIGLFVTLIFAPVWLWERFAKKTYSYSANEQMLNMPYGRYRNLYFDQVKSLTMCRERNTIILHTSVISAEVFAADEDFDKIWHCFQKWCNIQSEA